MKEYTVVLVRPKYLSEEIGNRFGQDIYVALVEAQDKYFAVKAAQIEVFKVDKRGLLKPLKHTDYELCVLFEGKHDPKLFGWQV